MTVGSCGREARRMAENKTNAMRLLEKGKIPYTVHTSEAAQAGEAAGSERRLLR